MSQMSVTGLKQEKNIPAGPHKISVSCSYVICSTAKVGNYSSNFKSN